MTPPTMPPEIEAAIDKYERAAIANAGALGAPDEHAEHTATWLALTSAITSALVVAELRGRAAGREDALAQAPEIEAAIKALEADTFEHGKCPGTPRGLDLAAAREVKRNDLRAAIAADKARAVEGMRPVLSQADAERLVAALDDEWERAAETGRTDGTARAALLTALDRRGMWPVIRACDGHRGHGETGCGFSTSTWPGGECPMCGGAMIDAPVAAPSAPRRPVAGWVEFAGNYYLTSGEAFARVNGGGAWTLYAGRFTPKSWQTKGGRAIRDWRKATDVDAGKCAAEDALRAVLVDAAAVLGKRVVS